MKTFNSFLARKSLDQLAEKCVREQLPIVEFTQWYEAEGQYLGEGWKTNMGLGAAAGAGIGGTIGSFIPGVGTAAGGLAGAGLGALAGGAKSLWDKYGRSVPQQAQAAQAQPEEGGRYAQQRQKLRNDAEARGRDQANAQAAQQQQQQLTQAYQQAKQVDPLFQDLGPEVIGNLVHNGISPTQVAQAVKQNMAGGGNQEQAVVQALQHLGIRTRAGGHYAWNAGRSAYEWTKQDALNALNRLVELTPSINMDEVITVVRSL